MRPAVLATVDVGGAVSGPLSCSGAGMLCVVGLVGAQEGCFEVGILLLGCLCGMWVGFVFLIASLVCGRLCWAMRSLASLCVDGFGDSLRSLACEVTLVGGTCPCALATLVLSFSYDTYFNGSNKQTVEIVYVHRPRCRVSSGTHVYVWTVTGRLQQHPGLTAM